MALSFSSNDQEVIGRKIDVNVDGNANIQYDFDEFYEISQCVNWIKSNSFKCIALQFPDELLKDAAIVSIRIQMETQSDVYILGDTSYSSCCVDEIAAEHVSANAVIHFGHACLSPTNRLPVLYITGKLPLDVKDATVQFKSLFPEKETKVIICCDASYVHDLGSLKEQLVDYTSIIISEIDIPDKRSLNSDCPTSNVFRKCAQKFYLPENETISEYYIFCIGSNQQKLLNLMLSFNTCKFYSYNPVLKTGRQETLDINKYLRKRYYCIEKAKDASLVGLLVGTLGVSNYLCAIQHLRTLCANAGKKCYTIVVGKLNCAKLANFPEIDVFVYISCSESCIVDSRDFYQTIITPFEMEIACNQARQWTGDYITDFSQLLSGACDHVPLIPLDDSVGDVSLVTGKCRSLNVGNEFSAVSAALTVRDNMTLANMHLNAAGEHLSDRNWRGLECHLGETPVTKAVEGQKGIASAYEGEG